MGNAFIKESTLTAIADAIRAKTGGTAAMLPSAMASEIANMQTGGGSGSYVWSKRGMADTSTEDTTGGTYTLTTPNDTRPSTEIEYSATAPTYDSSKRQWIFANSTKVTLVNSDATLPSISGNVYVRVTSEPNVWYLVSAFGKGSSSPYLKNMTYSKKYTAAVDSTVEYVLGDTADEYPDGGWVDGVYYDIAQIYVEPKMIGRHWEKKLEFTNSSSYGYVGDICYANGIWFALKSAFGHYYSLDNGETWVKSSWTYTLKDIVYYDGLFVASTRQDIWYSTDGINWTQSNVTSGEAGKIFYHDGLWIACGSSSSATRYSTDGKNWIESNLTASIYGICYGNGRYVMGGYNGKFYHSTDGKTWTTETNYSLSSIYFEVSYNNGIFIGYGSYGIWYSTDGINWTQSNVTTNAIQSVNYIDGIFYAPAGMRLYYSINGKNWACIEYSKTYRNLCHTDRIWLTGIYQNGLYYSEDLQNWIQTNITTNTLDAICYEGGLCVASFTKYENSEYTSYLYVSNS